MTETPRVDDVTVSSQALGPALYIPVCISLSRIALIERMTPDDSQMFALPRTSDSDLSELVVEI